MTDSAFAVALLARRYGIRIGEAPFEAARARGDLHGDKALVRFFAGHGLAVRRRSASLEDLSRRTHLFPCVAPLNNGHAVILLRPPGAGRDGGEAVFDIVDPANPAATDVTVTVARFRTLWTGRLLLVDRQHAGGSAERPIGWRWFLPELGRAKGLLLLTFVVSLLLHALAFAPIVFIQIALDKVVGYKAAATLYVLTGGVILALLFNALLGYLRERFLQHIGVKVEARLGTDAFDRVLALPLATVRGTQPAQLEQTVLGVGAVCEFLTWRALPALFDLTGLIVFLPILLAFSVELSAVVLVFSALIAVVSLLFKLAERRGSRAATRAEQARAAVLKETVSSMEAVKALAQDSTQRRAWRRAAAGVITARDQRARVAVLGNQINMGLQQLLTVVIIFVGIELVFAGTLTVGSLVAVNMLAMRVVQPISRAVGILGEHEAATQALGMLSILWRIPAEPRGAGQQRAILGQYKLEDVGVAYAGGRQALTGVTLTLPPRRRIAIVGPAGAGKSTLLALLQGVLRPSRGMLTVDGVPLTQLDPEHYRAQVAALTAAPGFFHGTIEENLRRACPNIGERELEEALALSGIGPSLERMPDGMATAIDDRASTLSSADRQKLALARALAADPRVLLVDEGFNGLDTASLLALWERLPAVAAQRGLVLVTHALTLVRDFDLIVVLNDGRLAGCGRHEELLAGCPVYADLWRMECRLAAPARIEDAPAVDARPVDARAEEVHP